MKVSLALTSNTYKRSSPDPSKPELVVTIETSNADILTVELRGEHDSGTVLDDGFRAEHFAFYDLTTSSEVVNRDPFPGTCEPREALYLDGVLELRASESLETRQRLEDVNPLSDPVRQLEVGHEYRIILKPQTIWSFVGSKADLFSGRTQVPVAELPEGIMVTLKTEDELILKVEA